MVRATLASQARHAPALDDPAAVAIRHARRARRWRHLGGGLASLLALVVLAGGMVSVRGWWQEPAGDTGMTSLVLPPAERTVQTPPPWEGNRLGVAVRVVNRVWTGEGERLLLTGAGLVDRAYRTPHGLVYGNEEEILLRGEGDTVTELGAEPGRWRISPDAQRVVQVGGGTARLSSLDPAGSAATAQVEVPRGTSPVTFWDDRVVLAGPPGHGYGVWHPDRDDEPTWSDQIAAVYGPAGDDLVVLVGEPREYCLAVLGPEATGSDQPTGTGCDAPLAVDRDTPGWLSPDGRWLAIAAAEELLVVKVSAGYDGGSAVATCPRRESVEPVWLDDSVLLTADRTGAVSCDTDGATERLSMPDELVNRWDYVPELGGAG